MSSDPYIIDIAHNYNFYKLHICGTTVYSVTKYIGDSQYQVRMEFADLPEEVKNLVVQEINSHNNEEIDP